MSAIADLSSKAYSHNCRIFEHQGKRSYFMRDLARIEEQQSQIVELRFFGGLTVEESAEVLGISRSTAKRDWNVAKAWLSRQLKRDRHGEG
jgi:RNA polymerase sigma factor (sigma-70 family)